MKEIPLTQGYVAQVDDADFDYLNQWKWHVSIRGDDLRYARRGNGGLLMHQMLVNVLPGFEIDHKDGNGLNNQRSNNA